MEFWYSSRAHYRERGDRTHPSSSSHQLKNTSREVVLPLYCPSSAPKAIHHTTHWSRVLHHNGGPNQYKHRVSCVVHYFHLSLHERIGRRSIGERSPRAPQCSNLKGLLEPEIRHLARQVGVCRNLSSAVRVRSSVVSMDDARWARAERRAALATSVTQTAPVGGRPRRSPSPAANAATGPVGNDQQASFQHPSVRQDGRTATPSLAPARSSSRVLRAPMEARAALIAANELLRYRPSLGQCLDHLPSSERVGARGKRTHGAEGVKEHCA